MLSRRKLPVNITSSEVSFFEHELVKDIPSHALSRHYKSTITPDGVFLLNGEVVPESLYAKEQKGIFDGLYRFYYNCISIVKRKKKGTYLLAFDAWSIGYFHWMTEFIPRLFKSKHLIQQSTVILPTVNNGIWNKASAVRSLYRKGQKVPEAGYFIDSLEAFNLNSTFRHLPQTPLVVSDLYFSSHVAPSGNYDDLVMRELRAFYFNYYKIPKKEPHRLVYVSRNLALRRQIKNEDEVIACLRPLGFEVFSLEELSFQEQVILLSQTKFLIAQHGAALTNLLFMEENSYVMELKTEGDSQNLCYFSLASAMNVNYLYQFSRGDGRSVQDADIIVDVDKLVANIKLVLS